jgi:RNA polymerase sigma-70 factor (ECF subfamily)
VSQPGPRVSLRPAEINGGPGALYLDGQQRLIAVLALDIAGARSPASARSSTPTSWRTSGRSRTSQRY